VTEQNNVLVGMPPRLNAGTTRAWGKKNFR